MMEIFFFLMLIVSFFIYWCVSEKTGLQLGIVVSLSMWAVSMYIHFGKDVFPRLDFSWVIIALLFILFILLRGKIEALILLGGSRVYIISAAAVSFLMILNRPSFEYVLPGGLLMGLSLGYFLNKRFLGFKSADTLQKKGAVKYLMLLMRFVLGIAVLSLIVYRVEKIIQRIAENQNIELYAFLCCVVVSLWISFAAPWFFIKLRLAGTEKNDDGKKE